MSLSKRVEFHSVRVHLHQHLVLALSGRFRPRARLASWPASPELIANEPHTSHIPAGEGCVACRGGVAWSALGVRVVGKESR